MLIWSIFLTGVIALLFFMMYPRTDYIKTVETPIAQTAIIQFTEQHKSALELALKAVQKAAEREDEKYQGSGIRNNTLTIPYPDFATLSKTSYLPKGLDQLDWRDANGDLIQSRIVCINYDADATATLSTEGTCSIGGYNSTAQTTPTSGTRDYLITYSPKPAELDEFFPGWGVSWADETKNMDTCGIVKNGKIQSPKCPNGLCDLSASANTTRLQNLIKASGLSLKDDGFLEDDGFVCISPIDHYAYDGVSITGKNKEMLAYYDGINNTWTGHSNTTRTWYDLSGNENHGDFYQLGQRGNTTSGKPLTSVSGWQSNGYKFSGELDFLSLPKKYNTPTNDIKEHGVEIVADIMEPGDKGIGNSFWGQFFSGLGFDYIAQMSYTDGNYYFGTRNQTTILYTLPLSSAEENSGRVSISAIWKTNYKSMAQDFYLYGAKANRTSYENKFQYEKGDRKGVGEKMRSAIGISYAYNSYPKRVYVARLYNVRLTPAQIALNYQLDRKRFNIPKVVDDNDKDYTYLQGDETAYIQTGYIPNANTQINLTLMLPTKISAVKWLYGSRYAMNQKACALFWEYKSISNYDGIFLTWGSGGNQYASQINIGPKIKYDIIQNKNELTVNSVTIKNTGIWSASSYPMTIFAVNTNNSIDSRRTNMKLYSFKILENNEKQHDFIPAEDPFGRPSLYDKITGKFFYNDNNGGKFTLGTD